MIVEAEKFRSHVISRTRVYVFASSLHVVGPFSKCLLKSNFVKNFKLNKNQKIIRPFSLNVMKFPDMMTKEVLLFYFLYIATCSLVSASETDGGPVHQNFNPCCSMPCQHRGICIPKSDILYECECVKGYFGKSCERATFSRWVSDQFRLSQTTKQRLAVSAKLLWAVVNNIPILHETALRYVYLNGIHFGGVDRDILNIADDYTTLDAYFNGTYSMRGLPPVPAECPTPLGPKYLPKVEDVFDLLFSRRDFKPCPHGTNLMLATFAQHLTYQFFNTDPSSKRYSGLAGDDVSLIYGSDEITRRALRSMVKGKLKTRLINGEEYPPYLEDAPEVTMEYPESKLGKKQVYPKWAMGHKMLGSTPLTFAMATIWLREHNRLCDIMAREHPDWNDERIYQTVRWIVLGELLTITGGEYFQHLAQYRLKFGYKPQLFHDTPVRPSDKMQYEFSLIFQWHQTLPDVILINGKNYSLTNLMFSNNRVVFEHGLDAIVDAMSRNPAGQITYRNCGEAAKEGIKKLIEEGRKMRLHSLNDYRRFLDLNPYESFMDLVGNKEMADALQDLYGDIDAVEFVVGIFMEKHIGSVVPPTMISLAGPVALKGIIGNPLGSATLWRPSTFGGKTGFDVVQKATLQKLFCLNLKGNCKNNVWVSFRTPADIRHSSRRKIFTL